MARRTKWGSGLGNASVGPPHLKTTVAGDGLAGGAGTALSVNVDGAGLEINADSLRLKDAGVTMEKLAAAAKPPVYAGVDVTLAYAADQVISQGYAPLLTNSQGVPIPGCAAAKATLAAPGATLVFVPLLGGRYIDATSQFFGAGCVAPGTRTSIKGRYLAYADAPLVDTSERFTLGVSFPAGAIAAAVWGTYGSENEATRDDNAHLAVVVDDAENIKSYNTTAAGDASYTDSGLDADLSAGLYFELIIEVSSGDVLNASVAVTIKVNGNTILNAVAPAAAGAGIPTPFALLNQNGLLSDVFFKIEKVA